MQWEFSADSVAEFFFDGLFLRSAVLLRALVVMGLSKGLN
jgi:hypothetical protein